MQVCRQGRQPREEVSQAVRYRTLPHHKKKKNQVIGTEEKVHRGKPLVEKRFGKSEDTFYAVYGGN